MLLALSRFAAAKVVYLTLAPTTVDASDSARLSLKLAIKINEAFALAGNTIKIAVSGGAAVPIASMPVSIAIEAGCVRHLVYRSRATFDSAFADGDEHDIERALPWARSARARGAPARCGSVSDTGSEQYIPAIASGLRGMVEPVLSGSVE